MAKKSTKSAIQHDEPENEAEETSETGAGKTISKAEAIRQALDSGHVLPEDGTDFIRRTFGIDVSRQHFSASKSQIKSKDAEKQVPAPKGRPRKSSQAIEGYLAPPKIVPTGEGDLIDALEKMKPLVASLGVDRVKRLADLLG